MAKNKQPPLVEDSPESSPDSTLGSGARWLGMISRLASNERNLLGDIIGIAGLTLAAILALALLGLTKGVVVERLAGILRRWLGWGSALVVFALAWMSWYIIRRRNNWSPLRWERVFALEIAGFALLAIFNLVGGNSLQRAEVGLDGGLVGWGLSEGLGLILGDFLRWVVLAIALVGGAIVGLGQGERVISWIGRLLGISQLAGAGKTGTESVVSVSPLEGQEPAKISARRVPKRPRKLPPEYRKQFRLPAEKSSSSSPPERNDRLPPLSILLTETRHRPDERHINLTAGLIEKTLAEFGIPVQVVGFRVGPTITQFAVEPGYVEKQNADGSVQRQKVRVSQISALSRDLALALSATQLRVQAPVPGQSFLGIEVPNLKSSYVRLRSILESETFYKVNSPLAIALGRDVSGQAVVADLAAMPHLLIAGTTGSGKSVCIAALTTCLMMNNAPEDLRLVMIDPKKVELVRFNGLPHLYGKVETEIERILGVLRWATMEMEHRYILLEKSRSRHIGSYNRKMRRRKEGKPLPRIVILIDELADLMISAPEATEHNLVRLAQKARATGIHLVVATQRPSTDVVTGLIKANFPARISFAVASSVDSRVILDMSGAEHLLGRGDMLFLPPDIGHPIRAQGVLVSDQEIERVITFWQQKEQAVEEPPPWEEVLEKEAQLAERDELLERAIELVRQTAPR
jgi:S-DNA-T family DNA segregation ATPase FtsK/SpoIIIE